MYGLIWKLLPGPTWFKLIEVLILLGLVAYALFTWVYPWISDTFVGTNPNLG
ncbi:hypothetical protein [Timonella sp. A28]|uniref:hypothetical protein n=1 Tax=Timonella sp. A28 TaxID=3442640 RepID=UPI003EBDEB8C